MTQVSTPEKPVPEKPPVGNPPVETSRTATVGAIRWNSALEFTHLFKGFRYASNPVKLMVALLAIFLVYFAGRAFDLAWGPQVAEGEIEYYQSHTSDQFKQFRDQFEDNRSDNIRNEFRRLAGPSRVLPEAADFAGNPRDAYARLKQIAVNDFHNEIKALAEHRAMQERDGSMRGAGVITPAEEEQQARQAAASRLLASVRSARNVTGRGIFAAFLEYEIKQFDSLIDNTLTFVRVQPVKNDATGGAALSGGLVSKNPDNFFANNTVVGSIANMVVTGPTWLFSGAGPMHYRPADANTWSGWLKMIGVRAAYLVSLLAYVAIFLAAVTWSGAFICRLTALEFSGQERPALKDVFAFVSRKFWTFFTAPIVPFVILLVVGVIVAAAGLIGAIPVVGEVLVGLVFIAFIGGGFILALILLGIVGGFNLLFPTIAAEGSDTFDAMSRSFAYVYARPWRLVSYSVVILVYGVITILFVSLSVYLVLALTHVFTGWGMSLFGAHQGAFSGQGKLDTLWPMPQFGRLTQPVNWYAMSWSEAIGAVFLHFWVYAVVGILGAYIVSYYHSAHTILYFLLRRSVEGQSLHDVYLEQPLVEKIAPAGAVTAPVTGGTKPPE